MSKGLDRPPDVIDQLCAGTDECLAGVQKRQVSPGLLTPVLKRIQELGIQELGIDSGQPG